MKLTDANEDLLTSLKGRSITDWHYGDDGMHFDLDDGRVVIFSGAFIIAVYEAEQSIVH